MFNFSLEPRVPNQTNKNANADFLKKYAEPISRGDKEATKELRTRIRPFILRRMKTEVDTELPKGTDTVLEIEFSEEERY